MSDEYPYSTPELKNPDVDFDFIAIDLSWSASFGNPVYTGTTIPTTATWADAFQVHFYSIMVENSSHGNPGGGEKGQKPLPIATARQRAGKKSVENGVVHARLFAKPANWVAALVVKVTMKQSYRWSGDVPNQQAIVFHAPEPNWFNWSRVWHPEMGVIDIDMSASPTPPHRGSIHFEAVAE